MSEEKVVTEEVIIDKEVEQEIENEDDTQNQKSYVKIREEKAQAKLLKSLGVKTIEEALEKMTQGSEALNKINELTTKLENAEKARIAEMKVSKITKMLDEEKAFDTDALLHYIELDKVEIDESGNIKDGDAIVTSLKSLKPHFFGTEVIKGDKHVGGTNPTPLNEIEEAYKAGNYVGAISKYLKSTKK